MPHIHIGDLYKFKELLVLASHQLEEHANKEDIAFAKENIETALALVVEKIKTHEYDPDF